MKYITPAIISLIIIFALSRKKAVYSDFTDGAADGMLLLKDIFPPLLAVLTAAAMLRASGAMDIAVRAVSPIAEKIGVPPEVLPLILIRPVSGSGAVGILSGILGEYGADSKAGMLASVVCGGTETTFYCIAVYFAKTRVKYVHRAVVCALAAEAAAVIAASALVRIL